ncbi:hypothetical protein HY948_03045 [Candidatus Gottesmanbacteria bacterium]|nr:hypothetical protein [Candidatus Gottesmanbacteria bacterium]
MIIGLAGLHGAGKSTIAALLHDLFGWKIVDKMSFLHSLYENSGSGLSWEEWRGEKYRKEGAYKIMGLVLGMVQSPTEILVIDSVHNRAEWLAIRETDPNALLIGVFAPATLRKKRKGLITEADKRRTDYWHETGCLLACIEWTITGTGSTRLQSSECRALARYLKTRAG